MKQLDKLGQVIELGDVVICAQDNNLCVDNIVTRFGAKDNIQVNSCSYVYLNDVVKITNSYIEMKGQKIYDNLKSKYKINPEPVKKQKKSVTYVIGRIVESGAALKTTNTNGSRVAEGAYYIFEVIGDTLNEKSKYWEDNNYNDILNSYKSYSACSLYLTKKI